MFNIKPGSGLGCPCLSSLLSFSLGSELAAEQAAAATPIVWVPVAQSGKVEAMFGYNEPLGGPVWTEVDKDE